MFGEIFGLMLVSPKKPSCTAILKKSIAQPYSFELAKEVPLDTVPIPIKAKPQEKGCLEEKMLDLPIVPPHLLTLWLLQKNLLRFQSSKAKIFWEHHLRCKMPWMAGLASEHPELASGAHFQPVGLYADEAEYTVSKEKITVLYLSSSLLHSS